MDTADNKCIWADQCGEECEGRCSDYSTIDESKEAKKHYEKILRENAEEYQQMIQDYSDEG